MFLFLLGKRAIQVSRFFFPAAFFSASFFFWFLRYIFYWEGFFFVCALKNDTQAGSTKKSAEAKYRKGPTKRETTCVCVGVCVCMRMWKCVSALSVFFGFLGLAKKKRRVALFTDSRQIGCFFRVA